MNLLEGIAQGLLSGAPNFVEIEDLMQRGVIGLLEADQLYEGPNEGFPEYAVPRVRASMLQEIPAVQIGSRQLQRIMRRLDERSSEIEQSLGRAPRHIEYAAGSGLTLDAYQKVICEWHMLRASLGKASSRQFRGLRAAAAADPLQAALDLTDLKALQSAFRQLPTRDRRMIKMHYGAGLTLKAIGASFGICESRVSQILSRAMAQMRAGLE
jgi:RNA polymerase sigma factor for flagellar operon FliA